MHAFGQARGFLARPFHRPIRQPCHRLGPIRAFAIGPRIKNVSVIFSDHRPHRIWVATVDVMKLREDGVATALLFSLQQRKKRTAIQLLWQWQIDRLKQRRQQVNRRNHVIAINLLFLNLLGPTNDQRRASALHIAIRFGERRRHSVIRKEHDDRVVSIFRFGQLRKNRSHHVIQSPCRGAVPCHLLSHIRNVGKESRHLHFAWFVSARRFFSLKMWCIRFSATVGPVRIV